jgi:hypothetical protein
MYKIILALMLLGCSIAYADMDMDIIAQIESSGNPNAYNERTNAVGLYQITLPALRDYNMAHIRSGYDLEEMYEPEKAYKVANWYMNNKIPRYLRHYNIEDTIENRIIAWNWGIGNLYRYHRQLRKCNVDSIPKETTNFIIKYKKLQY